MKKTRILKSRKAGDRHRVVTVSGDASYRRYPCEQCPWRKDVPTGVFPAEAFRLSAPTAYDMSQKPFACHMSGVDKAAVCAGFLLRGAEHSFAVRVKRMKCRIDMDKVTDNGVPLYDSYKDMAVANGVSEDDPVLAPCRSNKE